MPSPALLQPRPFPSWAGFAGQPDKREGLLSYFDWDPRMLAEHPYIDAMALFDRAQLSALGGYDNELYKVGWFGWEDYEFWLRMAAAHLRATLVPNILCLYRHHESAMSNTTNLFEVDLVRHLMTRYQPLIDEYEPKERDLRGGMEPASVTCWTRKHRFLRRERELPHVQNLARSMHKRARGCFHPRARNLLGRKGRLRLRRSARRQPDALSCSAPGVISKAQCFATGEYALASHRISCRLPQASSAFRHRVRNARR